MNLPRLFHTVRHLRPGQIISQLNHRIRRAIEDPAKTQRWNVPPFAACRWRPIGAFESPCIGANTESAMKSGTFTFLNRSAEIGFPPNWNPTALPKLWRYNLHYHDFLWLLSPTDARELIDDWIARSPAEAWEPYPTSLRLMNWCMLFSDRAEQPWPSIYRQTEWLLRHLETHLLGNHLLENAAALAMVGACFDGPNAERWFAVGTKLLRAQLDEQLLQDGGHFERSPTYHARVVYVMRQLRNTGDVRLIELIGHRLDRATRALDMMCHPDGRIALFNDSAFGIHPVNATSAPMGPFALPHTGYFGDRTEAGHYILCDAGPIGPDYQPGHAHGDIFSFELSLHGHRVIVDSGVHDYDRGAMRDYCRSTRAHNTVELFGQDQCEFWDVFRVGRRARISGVTFQASPHGFRLSGEHDGYRRVTGKCLRHARRFDWHRDGNVVISDRVIGSGLHRGSDFVTRFHLHPTCTVTSVTGGVVQIRYPAGMFEIRFENEGTVQLEPSFYCPEFGRQLDNLAVAFSPARVQDAISGVIVRISPSVV